MRQAVASIWLFVFLRQPSRINYREMQFAIVPFYIDLTRPDFSKFKIGCQPIAKQVKRSSTLHWIEHTETE